MKISNYILIVFLLAAGELHAQKKVFPSVRTWRFSDLYSSADTIPPDTAHINFQNVNKIDRYSIVNSYNGNLGSPLQSKLYFQRPETSDFIFSDACVPYLTVIDNNTFYNTKTPFSNVMYLTGGTLYHREEEIAFLFTSNAGKNLNFGTTLDYVYAKGEYSRQGTTRFTGTLFGTYSGKRYSATGLFAYNNLSNKENGGIAGNGEITAEMYLLDPPYGFKPENFPTHITSDVQSNYKQMQLYYNQQYNIGFERLLNDSADSTRTEYVPVTKFGHRLKIDDLRKRYYELSPVTGFYKDTFDPLLSKSDTAGLLNIANRISISMAEEFNTLMRFGLTAFVENEVQRFTFRRRDSWADANDSLIYRDTVANPVKSNTKIGAILSKEQGQGFTYQLLGELVLQGYKLGDFVLQADLSSRFRLWKDSIQLQANGFVRSDETSLFLQNYTSKHFRWDNNFSKIYRTRIGGLFSVPTKFFSAQLSVENITNTVYFDSAAVPRQHDGNVQILSLNVKQDFHFWKFAMENNAVYQASSNQEVVPLPALALYHNLYFYDKWFKVLSMQAGADVHYHTAYYAPNYMPATGQFFSQRKMKVGNYPVMSVYANVHLKRFRFFVKYYHVNQLFMKGIYYSMPGYPLFPAQLKAGMTWNFYD